VNDAAAPRSFSDLASRDIDPAPDGIWLFRPRPR
jgi:hypothetical protein